MWKLRATKSTPGDLQCEEATPNSIRSRPSASSDGLPQEEDKTSSIATTLESQDKMDTDEASQSPRLEEKIAQNSSVLEQSTSRVTTALRTAVGGNTLIRKLTCEKRESRETSQGPGRVGTAFIWDPRYYLRLYYRKFLTSMSFALCLTTLTVEQCWVKVNQGLTSIRQYTANFGRRTLLAIVNLTPRKMLKWLMVYMCQVVPSLRHRSAVVFLSNKLPSSVTKRFVSLYLKKLPLWAMRLHIMASLEGGPIKKMIDGFLRLLKLPKTLLKTTFMTLASGLEILRRVLRISHRRPKEEERVQISQYQRQWSLPSKLEKQLFSPRNKDFSSDQE